MVNFVCIWRQSVPVENLWKTIDSCGKLFLCSYTHKDLMDLMVLMILLRSYVYIMVLMCIL
jgi:hypothetical protein